jgi:pyruvate, orthophosphate dikinase
VNRWTVRVDGSIVPDPQEIGGKAASIARMRAHGLRVPSAFVVTTAACRALLVSGEMPADVWTETEAGIAWLEAETGRSFGGSSRPLLVAVRSGAAVSMPGMMDTVLDLGINCSSREIR